MAKIIPLISSGVAGPLGAVHLPRLWLKVSLEAAGKLADGYPACGTGFDQMVLEGLGLDKEKTLLYIRGERPTYPQFEAWVKQNGTKVDGASIEASNAAIRGYLHKDDVREAILTVSGVRNDETAPKDAVALNNLDDWFSFHQGELKT